ncbi:MAG: SPASM domain-containing protein [Planctomycetes bacterium]|nr:SPASM domain-containing protein [Planctomycetota bacterium]
MPVLREKRFLRVKLDMVGRCQLKCIMCHFAHPEFVENSWTMGEELLEKVAADLFPRAHDVVLSSSAEPLMAPDLPRALELCRKYEVPNFHFSTNGLSLNAKIIDKVIEVQMPLLTISIDGATKETFEAIRTPAKWDVLMKRFDLIAERKKALGSDLPALSATAVLMHRNIHEMPDLVRLMYTKGVRYMNFVHMAVIGGMDLEKESLLNEPKLCNETMAEVQRVADELGMQIVMPIPLSEANAEIADSDVPESDEGGGNALMPDEETATVSVDEYLNHKNREFLLRVKEKTHHNRPCYFPWYYIHVNPDGTVFPCGSWWEHTVFGDFKTQTFEEIWTGEKFTELRRQLYHMELRKTCANCAVSNMGRPDVKASFSQRAKFRAAARAEAGVIDDPSARD